MKDFCAFDDCRQNCIYTDYVNSTRRCVLAKSSNNRKLQVVYPLLASRNWLDEWKTRLCMLDI